MVSAASGVGFRSTPARHCSTTRRTVRLRSRRRPRHSAGVHPTPASHGGKRHNKRLSCQNELPARAKRGPRPCATRCSSATANAVARVARSFSEEALKTLIKIMRDGDAPGAVRIKACEAVLNRGIGPVDVTIQRMLAKMLCKWTTSRRGRKPGVPNKRTLDALKFMGPVGEGAIAVLIAAMEGPGVPWPTRVQAASLVADRAYGRCPQNVSLDVTRKLDELSLAELIQLEAKLTAEQHLIELRPEPVSTEPKANNQR
jgi:hypothetical protein